MGQALPGVLVRLSEVAAGQGEFSDDGFDAWYQRQQLLDPLTIDGIRSARRYRVAGGEPTFMTVYGCQSIDALATPRARAALAMPGVDSAGDGTGRRVRDTMQLACRETWSVGGGMGGSAIVVQCKPMQGREDAAREFIRESFGPVHLPALVRVSLWEGDSTLSKALAPAAPAAGPHWMLSLESYDVARMALAVHNQLLGCESARTGLLIGSWTRCQLISAHDQISL